MAKRLSDIVNKTSAKIAKLARDEESVSRFPDDNEITSSVAGLDKFDNKLFVRKTKSKHHYFNHYSWNTVYFTVLNRQNQKLYKAHVSRRKCWIEDINNPKKKIRVKCKVRRLGSKIIYKVADGELKGNIVYQENIIGRGVKMLAKLATKDAYREYKYDYNDWTIKQYWKKMEIVSDYSGDVAEIQFGDDITIEYNNPKYEVSALIAAFLPLIRISTVEIIEYGGIFEEW